MPLGPFHDGLGVDVVLDCDHAHRGQLLPVATFADQGGGLLADFFLELLDSLQLVINSLADRPKGVAVLDRKSVV